MNLQRQSKQGDSDGSVSDTNSTLSNEPEPVSADFCDVQPNRLSPESDPKALYSQGDFTRARTRKKDNNVNELIKQTKDSASKSIDLSRKGLHAIPDELFEIDNLEYLYLEGNEISSLPDTFFHEFPNLKWLDLRRNKLVQLPAVYTGRHRCLRNLLLEGNCLKNLPLELGLIKSLNGLNIRGNPLEFPPPEIVEKGTAVILKFLQEMINAKSEGFMINGNGHANDSSSSDDWNEELEDYTYSQMYGRGMSLEDTLSAATYRSASLVGPVLQTAELHRPVSYTEMKQERVEKLRKAGAMGTVDRQKPSSSTSVRSWKVNHFPQPPPAEYVDFKMNEERKLAKVKDLKEKQDAILQRRRDEQMMKDWRDETKKQQQKKYLESLHRGSEDTIDIALQGPYAVEKEHLRLPSNAERIKQDVKSAHENMRRPLSPASKQRIELEKSARIEELERRIKQHTASMHERRKQPRGTPQQEMEAAKRELEIAEELHRELLQRRKDLEYRFRAFTADTGSGIGREINIQQLNI
ncbi:hypothetical protein ScPMuIL_000302 [Solemya velum]